MPEQELDLFQLTAGRPTQPRACSAQIMRRESLIADPRRELLHHVPTSFSVTPSPQDLSALLTFRKSFPV
jgi:hypothetical protein